MKIFEFYYSYSEPVVIALGFFDSVHKGHKAIINEVVKKAKEMGAIPCVFTFDSDVGKAFGDESGLVYTYAERLKKLEKLQVESVISATFTKGFSMCDHREFLELLTLNFNVYGIVCGNDYRYGKDGEGNVETLSKFCNRRSINLTVIGEQKKDGERISTTKIKKLLSDGRIEEANSLLGDSYFISGEVVKGRAVGREMGFPTANVLIDQAKARLKLGVYKTHVEIDGKRYNCITNYGGRPTFDLNEPLSETYIHGFDGDLYGKNLTVYFDRFIREPVKFSGVDGLIKQLKEDLEKIND